MAVELRLGASWWAEVGSREHQMKHAEAVVLDQMADLLQPLRKHPQLTERTTGAFYRGTSEFLHFYQDSSAVGISGVIAEVKSGASRKRWPVATVEQRRMVFAYVLATLARLPAAKGVGGGERLEAEVPRRGALTRSR